MLGSSLRTSTSSIVGLLLVGLASTATCAEVRPTANQATLRETACDANCDLRVMGAYGLSGLREYVFGGVTRDMFADWALPILMFN